MTRTGYRWCRRGGLATLLLSVSLLGTLAGCTTVHSELGTSNGSCYVAIPAATAAVHQQGVLLGVRLVSVESIRRGDQRILAVARAGSPPKGQRVCLVAFAGHYAPSSVSMPSDQRSGRLAIVVLRYPGNKLLGTVVFHRAPLSFGHSHFA